MRVLFNLLDAGIGGGQLVAARVAEGLVRAGHEVGLLVPEDGPAVATFTTLGAQPVFAQTGTLRRPAAVLKTARLVRDFDLLYAHTSVPGEIIGAGAARIARRPCVVHQHPVQRYSAIGAIALAQRALLRTAAKNARFIAVADHIAADLVAHGILRERIDVVPNGVPVPDAVERTPGGETVVGMLGRIDTSKGIETFLAAAALVRIPGVHFVAGVTSSPFVELERRIRHTAGAAGVELVEAGGSGQAFLRSLDILAFPSRNEGSPLVLLEALALGLPVVASDIPGVREVIGPDGAGVLVPVDDPRALAAAITELATDADRRQEVGRRGREVVVSRYGLDAMIARTIGILEAAAGRG